MPASPFRRPLRGGRARILLLLALLAVAIGLLTLPPAAAQGVAVTLSVDPTPVAEGSSVTVTVTLASAATANVSIPITLTDVSAESTDHGALTTISVDSGATTGTGTITTAQDTDTEDETFTVALGALPTGYTAGTPSSVEVTIEDDETKPTASISATPTSVTEGSNYTVTVTLSAPVTADVSVLLDLTYDSAETADFEWNTFGVSVTAGGTSGDISGTTAQDTDTQDETFTVSIDTSNLGLLGLAAGAVTSVTITILDDDPKPTVELKATPNPVVEGHNVIFTLTLSAAASQAVTIPLIPDTAATEYLAAADVTNLRSGAPVDAGNQTGSTLVIIPQDADALDETFTVSIDTAKLGELGYAAGSVTSVAVTVEDDERLWFVNLSATPEPVPEGSPVTVTATLSRPAAADVAIPLMLTDTAIDVRLLAESDDYDASSLSPITISAGETTGTATIVTNQDAEAADDYFNVVLDSLPTDYRDGDPAAVQIHIADDEQFALQVNYGDTELLIGPYGGISSTDTTHYVEASPTMRSLTLTPTWPEARMDITVSASVRYTMHSLDGATLNWGVNDQSQSRTLNMYSPLGSPGYPRLTFTVGSDEYTIVFHNNGAWEFHHNNLLARLKMILGR